MTNRENIIAFLGVLVTIITLAICGTVAVSKGQEATVYLAAITGLIGVIGTFRPRSAAANVEQADTVNQGTTA